MLLHRRGKRVGRARHTEAAERLNTFKRLNDVQNTSRYINTPSRVNLTPLLWYTGILIVKGNTLAPAYSISNIPYLNSDQRKSHRDIERPTKEIKITSEARDDESDERKFKCFIIYAYLN